MFLFNPSALLLTKIYYGLTNWVRLGKFWKNSLKIVNCIELFFFFYIFFYIKLNLTNLFSSELDWIELNI